MISYPSLEVDADIEYQNKKMGKEIDFCQAGDGLIFRDLLKSCRECRQVKGEKMLLCVELRYDPE